MNDIAAMRREANTWRRLVLVLLTTAFWSVVGLGVAVWWWRGWESHPRRILIVLGALGALIALAYALVFLAIFQRWW